MHGSVRYHYEHAGKNSQANHVRPQRAVVEAERAQNRRTRDFNVEAVFMVDKCQIPDFVDDQRFEAIMEDR